jgi:polyhydroxyalkanoate synthesis repressor PhaR
MASSPEPRRLEIKKYPNRRFYDVSRSRHVTLAELYELVRSGVEIQVRDSKTDADITNLILAQMILEHDPPKMDLFPASLLHQAIQANQDMVRRFVDQYLSQALSAFAVSRKQFEEYLQRAGFSALSPLAPFDWVRMLIPGMSGAADSSASASVAASAVRPSEEGSIRTLQREVDSLREELRALRGSTGAARRGPRRPARKKPRRRGGGR